MNKGEGLRLDGVREQGLGRKEERGLIWASDWGHGMSRGRKVEAEVGWGQDGSKVRL